jgi:hypothetical protein
MKNYDVKVASNDIKPIPNFVKIKYEFTHKQIMEISWLIQRLFQDPDYIASNEWMTDEL